VQKSLEYLKKYRFYMQLTSKKFLGCIVSLTFALIQVSAQGFEGYYQHPDIHKNTIVFVAEGDIWKVSINGGLAQRLTTHAEEEKYPVISPDGTTIAYSASYEGPTEVYTIPILGGLTKRWTFGSDPSTAIGWTPDGKIVYTTSAYSKLPNQQLITLDLNTKKRSVIPLFQANDGVQIESGTWFFVPHSNANDHVKRYVGGWARQIWKFEGNKEAVKLTKDHLGESFNPMWHQGRVYFITDRDGVKNIWSMNADGADLKQHTMHKEFDARSASLDNGKIVYQHAADLWLLDIATGKYNKIDIRLASDLEELREKWVEDISGYTTSVNPDTNGENVVITARGRVFVVPVKSGRTLAFTDKKNVRYRDAAFNHDGKNIITLSDESGEYQFTQLAADGSGKIKLLTSNEKLLRYEGVSSPDGKWVAYRNLGENMYILNVANGISKKISTNQQGIEGFSWSPDSKWLAFVQNGFNLIKQIKVYNVIDASIFDLTSDKTHCYNPKWSPDGKFIYFLSDRGSAALPHPHHLKMSQLIMHVALKKGTRSPFREIDELNAVEKKDDSAASAGVLVVNIDKENIQSRARTVPVPSGIYWNLEVNDKALYMMSGELSLNPKISLKVVEITNQKIAIKDVVAEVSGFQLSRNGQKMLINKEGSYYMVDAGTGSVSLDESKIDFSGCKFSLIPGEDWKQMYRDAWRMERDNFYDKNMHGVDWDAMYKKYLPLLDRLTTRNELNDVIQQLIGELSALHTGVSGGDIRSDNKSIGVASLGAITSRDEANGGFRIDYIYKSDPDFPDGRSPLEDPYLDIREGDIITMLNNADALSALDIGQLIRNQANKQIRLTLKRGSNIRDVIIKPLSDDFWLRYTDWQYGNRLKVEKESEGKIGYLYMSAMEDWDLERFYKQFYPIFNRKGLIIDVRNNGGGNVEAAVIEKLLRKAWMYWKDRNGEPYSNMHYAFTGHLVVLVNGQTGSNGETFPEGIRRLSLGTTIGTRTWGGQIWIGGGNEFTDNGSPQVPLIGEYGLDGKWLIEGHGHVPDVEIDNLPYETFNGKDAQLDAAIKFLQKKIAEDPRVIPPVPNYPDKSFKNNRKQ
jgi:tricorn protease